jgi:hypothetical protein
MDMMPDILHGQAWEQEVYIGIVKPNGLLKTEKKNSRTTWSSILPCIALYNT